MPTPAAAHSVATLDLHRALLSLREELDAVDWYQQRAEECADPELAAILTHNKDEEVEHAMMILEWIRRTRPGFDANARRYLFATGSILAAEQASPGSNPAPAAAPTSPASLQIGSLKG